MTSFSSGVVADWLKESQGDGVDLGAAGDEPQSMGIVSDFPKPQFKLPSAVERKLIKGWSMTFEIPGDNPPHLPLRCRR